MLPGYTHLQRAQPVLLGHYLAAHAWALARDDERLRRAYDAADVSTLGAGALAGSSLPLDPAWTAASSASRRPSRTRSTPSPTATSSCDLLYACALAFVHLSRLGEEVVIFTSQEFGLAELDDRVAMGSSMMPQKKNPQVAEHLRGRAGVAIGRLTGFLAVVKGLPLAYDSDLQEDKEALFGQVAALDGALEAAALLVRGLRFDARARRGGRRRRLVRRDGRRRGARARGRAVPRGARPRRRPGRGRRAVRRADARRRRSPPARCPGAPRPSAWPSSSPRSIAGSPTRARSQTGGDCRMSCRFPQKMAVPSDRSHLLGGAEAGVRVRADGAPRHSRDAGVRMSLLGSPWPDSARVEDGVLVVGGCRVDELAAEYGTPLYVYDAATLRARARAYAEPLAHRRGGGFVAFAVKACGNLAVLRILVEEGLGFDVSSEGELAAALAADGNPERIVLHGNAKTDDDIDAAVAQASGS